MSKRKTINKGKQLLQNKEFDKLKLKKKVILKWATGTGKSKMTIELVNNAAREGDRILFVVAERAHIANWQEEFQKWNMKVIPEIICYASMHKIRGNSYDIIVFDEGHHLFTERRLDILTSLQLQNIYLLSATLSSQKISLLEDICGKFDISTVTLKDAIEKEILPEPRINIIELSLDNTVPDQEIKTGKGSKLPIIRWEDRGKYAFSKTPCIIKCTQRQKYLWFTENMEYWKSRYMQSNNQFHHNKWVSLGSMRKRFLGDLKTKYVKSLIESLPKKSRFICFCSSVNQAESLNSQNTISSRKSTKFNQIIIDTFNAKKINTLFAVGMATEGMNLTDIQKGIIVQLDGKERLFVQKVGRALRADNPVAYIFYYKGTQDEVYLRTALENVDTKYVKFHKQQQL